MNVNEMSISSLEFAKKDLTQVIEIQEAMLRQGWAFERLKLGKYYDDLYEVVGELKRRRK